MFKIRGETHIKTSSSYRVVVGYVVGKLNEPKEIIIF